MRVNVLVQSISSDEYTATILGWPEIIIKGKTKDETINAARNAVEKKLTESEIVTFDINDESSDPWMQFAGMWKDDPTFDDFLGEMSNYRKQVDEAESP